MTTSRADHDAGLAHPDQACFHQLSPTAGSSSDDNAIPTTRRCSRRNRLPTSSSTNLPESTCDGTVLNSNLPPSRAFQSLGAVSANSGKVPLRSISRSESKDIVVCPLPQRHWALGASGRIGTPVATLSPGSHLWGLKSALGSVHIPPQVRLRDVHEDVLNKTIEMAERTAQFESIGPLPLLRRVVNHKFQMRSFSGHHGSRSVGRSDRVSMADIPLTKRRYGSSRCRRVRILRDHRRTKPGRLRLVLSSSPTRSIIPPADYPTPSPQALFRGGHRLLARSSNWLVSAHVGSLRTNQHRLILISYPWSPYAPPALQTGLRLVTGSTQTPATSLCHEVRRKPILLRLDGCDPDRNPCRAARIAI